MGAAGAGGASAGLDINEVFSTYLYSGTNQARSIVNGIDLSGEGGLVWLKDRDNSAPHTLHNTAIGPLNYLISHSASTNNSGASGYGLTAFNNNGFSLGTDYEGENGSGKDYVSWTFREASKFFDIVTYTGNGVAGRQVAHNLGTTVGMLVVKCTSHGTSWKVQHRSSGANNAMEFDDTRDATVDIDDAFWNDTAASSTHFTVGDSSATNGDGRSYIAFLFAHNASGDGGFGPDGDQDIIVCDEWEGSTSSGTQVDLGFQPQWILIKQSAGSNSSGWQIFDDLRGLSTTTNIRLLANENSGKGGFDASALPLHINSTGFEVRSPFYYASGRKFIYMAIRQGTLNVPDDADKVFDIDTKGSTGDGASPAYRSGFPVDMAILRRDTDSSSGETRLITRLTGVEYLRTYNTSAAASDGGYVTDFMNGWNSDTNQDANYIAFMWKRAPSFFDVVCYDGSDSNATFNHSLGVAPEMIWIKKRTNTRRWRVFIPALSGILKLNETGAMTTNDPKSYFGDGSNIINPTATQFTVTAGTGDVNASGDDYIALLFATADGVSKVGSYTGNGGTQNIDCGFSSGARFILIKSATDAGSWFVHDSVRGIVAGNDPRLKLDQTDAEATSADYVDPLSSGFTVNGPGNNDNGQTYLFYAVA